jgi:hypothetical protein
MQHRHLGAEPSSARRLLRARPASAVPLSTSRPPPSFRVARPQPPSTPGKGAAGPRAHQRPASAGVGTGRQPWCVRDAMLDAEIEAAERRRRPASARAAIGERDDWNSSLIMPARKTLSLSSRVAAAGRPRVRPASAAAAVRAKVDSGLQGGRAVVGGYSPSICVYLQRKLAADLARREGCEAAAAGRYELSRLSKLDETMELLCQAMVPADGALSALLADVVSWFSGASAQLLSEWQAANRCAERSGKGEKGVACMGVGRGLGKTSASLSGDCVCWVC